MNSKWSQEDVENLLRAALEQDLVLPTSDALGQMVRAADQKSNLLDEAMLRQIVAAGAQAQEERELEQRIFEKIRMSGSPG